MYASTAIFFASCVDRSAACAETQVVDRADAMAKDDRSFFIAFSFSKMPTKAASTLHGLGGLSGS
jgi:hypothetical protein